MAEAITLDDIERLTIQFAEARNHMLAVGDALDVDLEVVRQAHLPTLTEAARDATKKMNTLFATVKANPHLFAAKGAKSKVFAGIKVGLQSTKAKVIAPDDIKGFYDRLITTDAELADRLVKVEHSARQAAFNALDDEQLATLDLTRKSATDAPLVKPVDEEAAKIVDALIKAYVVDGE